jgi:DNA-binding beta-propeller fold protein YncE
MSQAAIRTARAAACSLALAAGVGACAGAGRHAARQSSARRPIVRSVGAARAAADVNRRSSDPVALVTAESRNQLLGVDLRTGRIRRGISLPADPENVAIGAAAVIVSPAARTVTVLDPNTLHLRAEVHGFTAPHIPALGPDGEYAYITDDAAGTVTAIRLSGTKAYPSVPVGLGAHHLTLSPRGSRLWIALGESARTIVILDVANRTRPRVLRRFDPGFQVHDLLFSPNGREVWMSAATGPDVTVIDARTLKVRFRVPVGPPPQHIAFNRAHAYLTSGYGGTIEQVDAATGRILARAPSPYGSFELDAADGYVATASLLRGTLAIYDTRLRHRRIVQLAPATRDLAIMQRQP